MFALLGMQVIQFVIAHFVTFRSNQQGAKCKHVCHHAFTVSLFALIPIINLVIYSKLLKSEVDTGALFPYFTFNVILSFILEIWFFCNLIEQFEGMNHQSKIETDSKYQEMTPNEAMTFRSDMYSLLYVSLVKPQYKMYCDLLVKTG